MTQSVRPAVQAPAALMRIVRLASAGRTRSSWRPSCAAADPLILLRTPTDIFPAINIPVISVIWQYQGLSATEIEQRILYNHERSLSATVNDIEHIESNAFNGSASSRCSSAGLPWTPASLRSLPLRKPSCARCPRPDAAAGDPVQHLHSADPAVQPRLDHTFGTGAV